MATYDDFLARTHEFERTYWWFHGLRAYGAALLARLPARDGLRILDAGCGTGGNYRFLSRYGRVWAFDLLPNTIPLARTYGLTRSARASITDIPFQAETFDLVTSFDVLTALRPEERKRAVHEIRRVLRPGGYLFLNLAALMLLWGKQDVAGRIQVRYDRPLLRRELEDGGFEILHMSYAFAFTFPAVLAVRLADRHLFRSLDRAGAEGDFAHLPAPLNSLLAACARLEARAVGRFRLPFGSSLVALARRA